MFVERPPLKGELTDKQPTSIDQYWSDLKLPQGDEVPGLSQMVHFAGTCHCIADCADDHVL